MERMQCSNCQQVVELDGSGKCPDCGAAISAYEEALDDSLRAKRVPSAPSSSSQEQPAVMVDAAIDEDAVYAAIANELKTGATNEGLWTRLFAECEGDERRTKVAYIKHRAEKLIAEEQVRIAGLLAENQARTADHLKRKAEFDSRANETAQLLGIPLSDASDVVRYGITREGNRYRYKQYLYDDLAFAIVQAKRLRATTRPTPEVPQQLAEGPRTAPAPGGSGSLAADNQPDRDGGRRGADGPPAIPGQGPAPYRRPKSVAVVCIIIWISLAGMALGGALTLMTIPEDYAGLMPWGEVRDGLRFEQKYLEPRSDAQLLRNYARAQLSLHYSEWLGLILIAFPMLLAASVGVFRGKAWGRKLLILYVALWSSTRVFLLGYVLPEDEAPGVFLMLVLWMCFWTFVLTRQSWKDWTGGSDAASGQGTGNPPQESPGAHDMTWAADQEKGPAQSPQESSPSSKYERLLARDKKRAAEQEERSVFRDPRKSSEDKLQDRPPDVYF
jgi:hypothetical protein